MTPASPPGYSVTAAGIIVNRLLEAVDPDDPEIFLRYYAPRIGGRLLIEFNVIKPNFPDAPNNWYRENADGRHLVRYKRMSEMRELIRQMREYNRFRKGGRGGGIDQVTYRYKVPSPEGSTLTQTFLKDAGASDEIIEWAKKTNAPIWFYMSVKEFNEYVKSVFPEIKLKENHCQKDFYSDTLPVIEAVDLPPEDDPETFIQNYSPFTYVVNWKDNWGAYHYTVPMKSLERAREFACQSSLYNKSESVWIEKMEKRPGSTASGFHIKTYGVNRNYEIDYAYDPETSKTDTGKNIDINEADAGEPQPEDPGADIDPKAYLDTVTGWIDTFLHAGFQSFHDKAHEGMFWRRYEMRGWNYLVTVGTRVPRFILVQRSDALYGTNKFRRIFEFPDRAIKGMVTQFSALHRLLTKALTRATEDWYAVDEEIEDMHEQHQRWRMRWLGGRIKENVDNPDDPQAYIQEMPVYTIDDIREKMEEYGLTFSLDDFGYMPWGRWIVITGSAHWAVYKKDPRKYLPQSFFHEQLEKFCQEMGFRVYHIQLKGEPPYPVEFKLAIPKLQVEPESYRIRQAHLDDPDYRGMAQVNDIMQREWLPEGAPDLPPEDDPETMIKGYIDPRHVRTELEALGFEPQEGERTTWMPTGEGVPEVWVKGYQSPAGVQHGVYVRFYSGPSLVITCNVYDSTRNEWRPETKEPPTGFRLHSIGAYSPALREIDQAMQEHAQREATAQEEAQALQKIADKFSKWYWNTWNRFRLPGQVAEAVDPDDPELNIERHIQNVEKVEADALDSAIEMAIREFEIRVDNLDINDTQQADKLAAEVGDQFASTAGYKNGSDEYDFIVSAVNNRASEMFPGDWEDPVQEAEEKMNWSAWLDFLIGKGEISRKAAIRYQISQNLESNTMLEELLVTLDAASQNNDQHTVAQCLRQAGSVIQAANMRYGSGIEDIVREIGESADPDDPNINIEHYISSIAVGKILEPLGFHERWPSWQCADPEYMWWERFVNGFKWTILRKSETEPHIFDVSIYKPRRLPGHPLLDYEEIGGFHCHVSELKKKLEKALHSNLQNYQLEEADLDPDDPELNIERHTAAFDLEPIMHKLGFKAVQNKPTSAVYYEKVIEPRVWTVRRSETPLTVNVRVGAAFGTPQNWVELRSFDCPINQLEKELSDAGFKPRAKPWIHWQESEEQAWPLPDGFKAVRYGEENSLELRTPENEPAGHMAWRSASDRVNIQYRTVEIQHLEVDPRFQNRGLGEAMLRVLAELIPKLYPQARYVVAKTATSQGIIALLRTVFGQEIKATGTENLPSRSPQDWIRTLNRGYVKFKLNEADDHLLPPEDDPETFIQHVETDWRRILLKHGFRHAEGIPVVPRDQYLFKMEFPDRVWKSQLKIYAQHSNPDVDIADPNYKQLTRHNADFPDYILFEFLPATRSIKVPRLKLDQFLTRFLEAAKTVVGTETIALAHQGRSLDIMLWEVAERIVRQLRESLLEMGGAVNIWLSPKGKPVLCSDHAEHAASEILKKPLKSWPGNYWEARGRVYQEMYRRGWMRIAIPHAQSKLMVDYRGKTTDTQWEWIYDKGARDKLAITDDQENILVDYREGVSEAVKETVDYPAVYVGGRIFIGPSHVHIVSHLETSGLDLRDAHHGWWTSRNRYLDTDIDVNELIRLNKKFAQSTGEEPGVKGEELPKARQISGVREVSESEQILEADADDEIDPKDYIMSAFDVPAFLQRMKYERGGGGEMPFEWFKVFPKGPTSLDLMLEVKRRGQGGEASEADIVYDITLYDYPVNNPKRQWMPIIYWYHLNNMRLERLLKLLEARIKANDLRGLRALVDEALPVPPEDDPELLMPTYTERATDDPDDPEAPVVIRPHVHGSAQRELEKLGFVYSTTALKHKLFGEPEVPGFWHKRYPKTAGRVLFINIFRIFVNIGIDDDPDEIYQKDNNTVGLTFRTYYIPSQGVQLMPRNMAQFVAIFKDLDAVMRRSAAERMTQEQEKQALEQVAQRHSQTVESVELPPEDDPQEVIKLHGESRLLAELQRLDFKPMPEYKTDKVEVYTTRLPRYWHKIYSATNGKAHRMALFFPGGTSTSEIRSHIWNFDAHDWYQKGKEPPASVPTQNESHFCAAIRDLDAAMQRSAAASLSPEQEYESLQAVLRHHRQWWDDTLHAIEARGGSIPGRMRPPEPA